MQLSAMKYLKNSTARLLDSNHICHVCMWYMVVWLVVGTGYLKMIVSVVSVYIAYSKVQNCAFYIKPKRHSQNSNKYMYVNCCYGKSEYLQISAICLNKRNVYILRHLILNIWKHLKYQLIWLATLRNLHLSSYRIRIYLNLNKYSEFRFDSGRLRISHDVSMSASNVHTLYVYSPLHTTSSEFMASFSSHSHSQVLAPSIPIFIFICCIHTMYIFLFARTVSTTHARA
jgi:hypothetical protein